MMLPIRLALLIAAWSGFLALSYEVLWARFYSFASQSRAPAFGALLGSYLLGLSVGAIMARSWRLKASGELARTKQKIAVLLLCSSLLSFAVIPLAACLVQFPFFSTYPLRTLPLIAAASALLGIVLPFVCSVSVAPNRQSGARIAGIYVANIVGSGGGSLITGFLLMDLLSLGEISTLLLGLSILVSAAIACHFGRFPLPVFGLAVVAILCVIVGPRAHRHLYERLFYRSAFQPGMRFADVVETRHGVVTVDTNRVVFGGGVFDGIIDTRLGPGSGLVRPYFVSALHSQPRDVLVIGVSAGPWTQILLHNPEVKSVTAVEINPGYLEVIKRYPEVSTLLINSKLKLVIDDGRRWLRRNAGARFDAIIMNTTFHWRDFASALLSKEFLELTRVRLKPGGFVMWNCTGSARAVRTGMEVFPHTIMVMNNCVGSLDPIVIDCERWRSVLETYQINGKPIFDLSSPDGRQNLEVVLSLADEPTRELRDKGWHLRNRNQMQVEFDTAQIITDENLGHDFDFGWKELLGL